MSSTSVSRIESIAVDSYNKFYNSHKELFKKDIEEYWMRATKYKDERVRRMTYVLPNKKTIDYDPTEDVFR